MVDIEYYIVGIGYSILELVDYVLNVRYWKCDMLYYTLYI